jgi:hypothetical protein
MQTPFCDAAIAKSTVLKQHLKNISIQHHTVLGDGAPFRVLRANLPIFNLKVVGNDKEGGS